MSTDPATLRAEFWRLPETALVDRATVAAVMYLSTTSMESMAIKGSGPAYRRVGRRALYSKADVIEWANGRRVASAAPELGAAA